MRSSESKENQKLLWAKDTKELDGANYRFGNGKQYQKYVVKAKVDAAIGTGPEQKGSLSNHFTKNGLQEQDMYLEVSIASAKKKGKVVMSGSLLQGSTWGGPKVAARHMPPNGNYTK